MIHRERGEDSLTDFSKNYEKQAIEVNPKGASRGGKASRGVLR